MMMMMITDDPHLEFVVPGRRITWWQFVTLVIRRSECTVRKKLIGSD